MSPTIRRRRRAVFEDDEDSDSDGASTPAFDFANHVRTNRRQGSESPDPDDSDMDNSQRPRVTMNGHINRGGPANEDDNEVGPGDFQPGAIVRVKLTNFVTYENAEFFPGPNLNMVIGPNGTGKSSLVCAICLGLGWGPKHLGRAGEVGEFVKHNMPDATIEIELQRRRNEASNQIVCLRIIRDGNGRDWWLNNKKTSLKAVQDLTKSLSIQIDNLCQFLPQDKVSEFAALTPVELLQQTQRAAAPGHMLDWHNELKIYRKEQKELEMQNNNDKEQLETLEHRQEGLRAEVERLEERQRVQEQVAFLKKSRPFIEYRQARNEHLAFKARKNEAQERLKRLEARLGPTLQAIEEKKRSSHQINVMVNDRKRLLQAAEKAADDCSLDVGRKEAEITRMEQKVEAEKKADRDLKNQLSQLERKLGDLKARANNPPVDFNASEFNDRVRAKEHQVRDIQNDIRELNVRNQELIEAGKANRAERAAAARELAEFDTQEGQQMSKLESASKETAHAWKWVQDNMDSFEKEIYGPPIISCSIKDQRYADVVEAALGKSDFLAITAQTKADHEKLQDKLLGAMKLADVTLRKNGEDHVPGHPPVSQNDIRRLGFDGWASDFIDGPTPVLAMLCHSAKVNRTAVALKDVGEDQHHMIIENSNINSWITGKSSYRVSRRSEYGPGATSTATRWINPGRYWTDQPVDATARRLIEEKIEKLDATLTELKKEIGPIREKIGNLKTMVIKDLENEIAQIKKDKAELQKAQGEQRALPAKIGREQESIDKKQGERIDIYDRIQKIGTKHDLLVQQKTDRAFEYRKMVEVIRRRHEQLLEAEIQLIEARSDVECLEERNMDIVEKRNHERAKVKEIEKEANIVKETARKALRVCQAITAAEDQDTSDKLTALPEDLTLEALELDIAAEESKLDFIQANNPNAIAQFERFQGNVDKLKAKIAEVDQRLENLQTKITRTRGKWEPELDKLIAEISDAFAYNFEQIGCAGEVSVSKTDDFEEWAILIRVKFRENESLQVLDKHRQSGGERSVSTIFYLMALQSLARSPFRVVDEINQGMDPRNERMVHERMVEIACKEHTSQYFLITPKLLTGLRYDRRMKVLCIASGEYMPQDYRQLDVTKIIGLRRAIVGTA